MKLIYDIMPPQKTEMKITHSKNLIKGAMVRIVVLLLIIGLNWTGLSAVIGTRAYFNDVEISSGNSFTAGILDFVLVSLSDFSPTVVGPTQTASREISIVNNGNIHKYKVSAVDFAGSLCDWLDLEAELDGNTEYTGNLTDFTDIGPFVFEEPEDWIFALNLRTGMPEAVEGETCEFKFVFFGSQVKNDLPFGFGFNDTEDISNKVASNGLKINKVYYDVCDKTDGSCGDYKGKEGKNEWIELYNPLNHDVVLKNWEICDSDDCNVINPNVSIPAHGFALISHDNSTWVHYWEVPDGVPTIHELGGKFVNMDNDADMLILKNPAGFIIDQMNWGIPDENWPNYNSGVWNPGAIDVDEGHLLGRSPTGYDTDQPTDWKDFGLPTAHVDYPNGGEVWYVGGLHTIRWTATNPTGNDADLIIDLYYSADSGNTWVTVVKGTENDKEHDWRIPLFEDGYFIPSSRARIKVVATNPENFMVSAWDMSDEDFCPPIRFDLLTPEELEIARDLGLIASPPEDPVEPAENIEEVIEEISAEEHPLESPIEQPLEEQPIETPIDEPLETPLDESLALEDQPFESPIEQPLETPLDEDIPEEQPVYPLPTPEEEPVIKEEPVIVPKNPITQGDDDDENGDNSDSTDNTFEEVEPVKVPIITD